MSKKRSKKTIKRTKVRAARTSSPSLHSPALKIGDRVQIIDISEYLKDPNYDFKDEGYQEMRTAELFRFCIGREFTIRGFDKYGHVEIDASANRSVKKEFGKYHTIWSEPEFVKLVGSTKKKRK
jgi:hypothetical protein